MNKKILHLTIKKKWFDMIVSGDKKEEYREIKPYWDRRLNKYYDVIKFRNGYEKDSPSIMIKLDEISIGRGVIEWGAPEDKNVYILKMGEVIG